MTAGIQHHPEAEPRQAAELSGLILLLSLMAVLTALVLAFS
ncbi:hypothetical protein [Nocardioides sp. CER19]|nr:hypothetical protein [Nocardioides sp. CER19]MDH2413870.1 hypothetical protein [Nocardioides sp. CER19]